MTTPLPLSVDNSGYLDESRVEALSEGLQAQAQASELPPPRETNLRGEDAYFIPPRDGEREEEDDFQPTAEELDDIEFEQQLQEFYRDLQYILLTFALPSLARWLGRRFSLWAWSNYVQWYYQPSVPEEREARKQNSRGS